MTKTLTKAAEKALRAKFNLHGARLMFDFHWNADYTRLALFRAWYAVDVRKVGIAAREYALDVDDLANL